MRSIFSLFSKNQKKPNPSDRTPRANDRSKQPQGDDDFRNTVYQSVSENLDNVRRLLDAPHDMVTRVLSGDGGDRIGLLYIDGLVDASIVNDHILRPLQQKLKASNASLPKNEEQFDAWCDEYVHAGEIKIADTLDDIILAVLSGDSAVFVEGLGQAALIGTKGWQNRSIEEPVSEAVIRGPRDGFIENIRTNTTLIRRRLRDPNLRFDGMKIGRRSKTEVIVTYVDGVVKPELVAEVKRRLKSIDIDDVTDSGFIEQWIQDSSLSPFPQVRHTERPDKVSASIVQGKIGILVDGSPFALVVPVTFASELHSPEDFYERWLISSLLRGLRYIAAFIAVFLPGLYVALLEYHQGMIPSDLAFSIAGAREGVPFPAVLEAMLMEITLEILREAGIRLPRPIGQTIGIVGGLVIGEAAVSAGIVSPVMVIVVAVTAVATFALPNYSFGISMRMLRFAVIIGAALFGFYGLILVYIMINIHIANLKSFGVPYTAPFAPAFIGDWKDLIIRGPLPMFRRRPEILKAEDEVRADTSADAKGGRS